MILASAHSLKFVVTPGGENDNSNVADGNQKLTLRTRNLHELNYERYGYFQDDYGGLCLEVKTEDGKKNLIGSNIWFQKCEKGKPAQLWRFDDELKGKIHTALDDKKCLQAKRNYKRGSRVRIYNCSDRRKTQQWSMGEHLENITPIERSDIVAYTSRCESETKKGYYLVLLGREDCFYSTDWKQTLYNYYYDYYNDV